MQQIVRKLTAAVITASTALVLAACGGAQPASATQAAAPTSAPAAAPTSAPAAENGSAPTAAGAAVAPTDSPAPAVTAAASTAAPAVANTKLNLNEVTEEQLLNSIPGFGNRMVREFFEYRPYVSIQQFRREIGKYVGAAQVAQYEQYVYVPIDVDAADAETLQQLPGVDATTAADLIAGRPYGSNRAFLNKLAERVSAGDLAAAAAYLVAK